MQNVIGRDRSVQALIFRARAGQDRQDRVSEEVLTQGVGRVLRHASRLHCGDGGLRRRPLDGSEALPVRTFR